MSPTRLTGTRFTRGVPPPTPQPPARALYIPKRRKNTERSDRTSPGELLACLVAVVAMLTALAVVAPHLADGSTPSPREWAALLTLSAVLGIVCYLGHRTRR